MATRVCVKCGKSHDLIVEDTATKVRIHEFDVCYDCIWIGTKFMLIEEQINIDTDSVVPQWLCEKMKEVEATILHSLEEFPVA